MSREVAEICEKLEIPNLNESSPTVGNQKTCLTEKSVENIKMAFRIHRDMVQGLRGNYKNKYRRQGGEQTLVCQDCLPNAIETKSQWLRWENIIVGLELHKIEDMVVFFHKLLLEITTLKTGESDWVWEKTPIIMATTFCLQRELHEEF